MADKNFVRSMFNNIAPTYDKLNHILSLNIDKIWRKKAVKRICKNLRVSESQNLYCESGIVIDNIINTGFNKLGLGAFYRYGPYSFDKTWDNFVFKISIGFSL